MILSGASASVIPKNMTLNLNINIEGIFGGENKSQGQNDENNTYGERVGGQSVYTERQNNNPERQRNTDDMKITDESTATRDPLLDLISSIFGG
jgi:hypothetical protein